MGAEKTDEVRCGIVGAAHAELRWIERAHWDYNQTEQVRQQKGYKCDPVAFYAAMNMMYSDYCQAARDIGCNTVDFYAAMAKAFLEDADAPEDKIERYAECVAGA